ncbi:MAG: tRNA pseudouridine(55) synthase TruB [Deltaproteobacteria bacterium]
MNLSPSFRAKEGAHVQPNFTADGVLVLDKPAGLTSHDVVKLVKKILVLLINGATKLSPFLIDQDKRYRFTVSFGTETDTQDSTGRVVATHRRGPLPEGEISKACAVFLGEIKQRVPRFSAVRVRGQRLYRLARQGVDVTPPYRTVKIKNLDLCDLSWPEVTFEVTCSKGTYVRSLGADLACHLGCSGHVSSLRRLASGEFDLRQALTLEQFEQTVDEEEVCRRLITPAQALSDYPEIKVTYLAANNIRRGGSLNLRGFLEPESRHQGPYRVLDPDNNLVAVVSKAGQGGTEGYEKEIKFKSLRVFGTI